MKTSSILLLLFAILIIMPMTSFAQKPINCHFGDESRREKETGNKQSTLWYLKKNVSSKDKIKIYDKILDKLKD